MNRVRLLKMLILFAASLVAGSACGPGDALYRGFFKVDEVRVTTEKSDDSLHALASCTQAAFGGLQMDIGLIREGVPGMASNPRHLHIDPALGGPWSVQTSFAVAGTTITVKGNRPQELQFAPGDYKIAIYGLVHCDSSSEWRPFVHYTAQPVALTPGKEFQLTGNPKMGSANLKPIAPSASLPAQPSGLGFISISNPGSPSSYTITAIDLRSPTFPPLASTHPVTIYPTSTGHIGPVPSHGVYGLRYKINTAGVDSYICRRFVSSNTTNQVLSSPEIISVNCPQTPTLGPNDQIGP